MERIFCKEEFSESPLEHIVPESLGNIWYTLPPNTIWRKCNTEFSEFESKVILKTHLGFIRAKNGIKTKKGIPSKFEIGKIKGEGHDEFKKNIITIEGFDESDVSDYNPQTGSFKILIPYFHKSEMATAKMLLKIAYESIYKSQKVYLSKYNFSELLDYMNKRNNTDWPFLTAHHNYYDFKSIPTFIAKHHLNKIKCKLRLSEISNTILLFDFQYDYLNLTINILNRDYSWTDIYFKNDPSSSLYPSHLRKK